MKNSSKIAAFGVIGVFVLLAVAGATLANGAGTNSSINAYGQTSKMPGACDGSQDRLMINDQTRQMNSTGQGSGVCANQVNGACDGTHLRLMKQDQTKQINSTGQGTGVCANQVNGACDGTHLRLMKQDQTKQMNCSCINAGVCPNIGIA